MSLLLDIFNAYKTSMSVDGAPLGDEQLKVCNQLSRDLTLAIVDFLTKQTFTITEMKAVLEVEKIETSGPVMGEVLKTVQLQGIGNFGAPVVSFVTQGFNGVSLGKLNLKGGSAGFGQAGRGQGGLMTATGHAYIGRNPVSKGQTNEDTTKVKLLKQNIKNAISDKKGAF